MMAAPQTKDQLARAVVAELHDLGAKLHVLPLVDEDGAQRWGFKTRSNLPACRRLLLVYATFYGGGWRSTRDMSPGAKVRFGDPRFNAAFVAAVRGGCSR